MAGARIRGDLLRAAREATGKTQAELALSTGVSAAERIARWERGDEQPRPQFIPLLASELGVDPIQLLDGDPSDPDLARLRLAAGLTVVQMAARAGLSTMTYNRLERGVPVQTLLPETVASLANALAASVEVVQSLLPKRV